MYLTYNKTTGKLTGFIQESSTNRVPSEPYIVITKSQYRDILKNPIRYSVIDNRLIETAQDDIHLLKSAELFQIEKQREVFKSYLSKPVTVGEYNYSSSTNAQLNYLTAMQGIEVHVWRYSISDGKWVFSPVSKDVAKKILTEIQKRRKLSEEIYNLDGTFQQTFNQLGES